jgi:hypothetical protein
MVSLLEFLQKDSKFTQVWMGLFHHRSIFDFNSFAIPFLFHQLESGPSVARSFYLKIWFPPRIKSDSAIRIDSYCRFRLMFRGSMIARRCRGAPAAGS